MSLYAPQTKHQLQDALEWAAGRLSASDLTEEYALGPGRVFTYAGEDNPRECVVMEERVPGGQIPSTDGIRHLTILVRMQCPEEQPFPVNWHEQCHRLAAEALIGGEFEGALRPCRQTRLPSTPFANSGDLYSTSGYQLDLI